MCLVFCAFASWAVKTCDLQAPDAWKTSTYWGRVGRAPRDTRQGGEREYRSLLLPVGKCSVFLLFQNPFHASSLL
uniref:Secreted protein n=1 Tax=Malurus cyaneus samueli TaxID=2593467 RepID=A0A8C5U715_9PASS